ncbi:MAG: hypothetical protein M1840_005563 [Geoglossum simile]|nr:MAG: hypothetical protein M1840_005563 [Geoglossum simile]
MTGDGDNLAGLTTPSLLQPASIPPAYKYPVCPTFQHWVFPHNNLPPSWLQSAPPPQPYSSLPFPVPQALSSLGSAVLLRDGSCRMSNHRDGVQRAHLCPREENSWFLSNEMERYNLNGILPRDYLIDDLNNVMALRSDLHSALDRRVFAFVPKPIAPPGSPSSKTTTHFVTHVLQQTSEIGPFYHNASILPVHGVPSEFLLARFAWAIFPSLIPFLSSGKERLLLMAQDGPSVAKLVSADECYVLAGNRKSASRSRSASPKKRKAEDTPLESNSPRSISPLPSTLTDTQEGTSDHTISNSGVVREGPWSHAQEHSEQYVERLKERELKRRRPNGWTASKGGVMGSVQWMMEMGYDIMEDPRAESWNEDDKCGRASVLPRRVLVMPRRNLVMPREFPRAPRSNLVMPRAHDSTPLLLGISH